MTPSSRTGPKARELLVVCVDDDRQFLKSLEFFLPARINERTDGASGVWYRFLFLDEPREALKALQDLTAEGEEVALLISDQMMPNLRGTELLAQSRGVCPHAMRVLLTGHAGIESAIVAINERLLERYLTKPIENEEEFTLNILQILEQYSMQAIIRDQGELIAQLYGFSNRLNAQDGVDPTLETVRDFTADVLQCREVTVLGGELGHERVVSTDPRHPDWRLHPALAERSAALARCGGARAARAQSLSEIPGLEFGPREAFPASLLYGVLSLGTGVHGLILASEPRRGEFSEEDLLRLGHICDTASIALHHQVARSHLERAWAETRTQAAQLSDAYRRLRVLDSAKSNFLDFISHELRTPLSYLSATAMLEDAEDPAERLKLITIIQQGYLRLQQFIDEGLQTFHWMGPVEIGPGVACDLSHAARRIPERWPEHADSIEVVVEPGDCRAAIAAEHADDVLKVLVENAIKFSAASRGKIVVRIEPDAATVRIVVRDHGRGFPPEWAGEIFQPFTIVESKHHREGAALGLARVAAMTRAHGGHVHAHSDGLDRGAVFTVQLPKVGGGPRDAAGSTGGALPGVDGPDGLRQAA